MSSKTVPKLRFQEFSEDWEVTLASEHFDFRNGLNFTRGLAGQSIKVLGVGEFQANEVFHDDGNLPEVKIAGDLEDRDLLQTNDLLFVRSNGNKALIGRCLLISSLKGPVSFSGFTIRARPVSGKLFSGFASLPFRSKAFRNYLDVVGGGTNISNLNQAILGEYEFSFPSLPEQKRIADFLGAVDGKLAALREKEAALTRFKRGLMQALFSQTLRFTRDDGSSYPDWEEKRADSLFASVSNKHHSSDLPIIAVTQDRGAVLRSEIEIDIKSSAASIASYKVVEPGDFIISLRSFQGGIEYSEIRGICSPAYTILKPRVEIVDDFYKAYFKKERFIRRLAATVIGIRDGKQISYSAFGYLKIPYPAPEEQQKIADALSAMDAKIAAANEQITQLSAFKKGLLQQMFV